MTKNEQIASILLEAAELLKRGEYDNVLTETIESPSMLINDVLNEAIEGNYGDVTSLLEAAEDMPSVESEINEVKNETDIAKASAKSKGIVDKIAKWYYKVEPNKKFKILRKILKIFNAINYQLMSKLATQGVMNRALYAKNKVAKSVGIVFAVIGAIASMGLSLINNAIPGLYASGQYKYNIKDFDANIAELEKGLEKINRTIQSGVDSKTALNKAKASYEKAIAELKKEKIKYDKLKNSKISARGAAIRKNENNVEVDKALKEAVDLLYKAAVLCEDTEKASSYIEKAEILQEAMSELDSF